MRQAAMSRLPPYTGSLKKPSTVIFKSMSKNTAEGTPSRS